MRPACGDENHEFFAYCGTCGASLVATAPARESRKTVTLVFADPKPVTADGAPPAPEALRDVMPRYFEAMRVALQRAGQTESRIEVYPGAPHGFHADYRDSYAPAAAADGWAKLLALYEARLK